MEQTSGCQSDFVCFTDAEEQQRFACLQIARRD
jgi:hypothetical protein